MNGAMLGQVPIREGSGFQQGSWLWPNAFSNRARATGVTREVISPYGEETNLHCYQCADGDFRVLTIEEADSLRAAGEFCTPVNNENCPGFKAGPPGGAAVALAGRMGQDEDPAPPAPPPAPPGNGGDGRDRFFFPPFFQFPVTPPYGPVPHRRKLLCKRDEALSEEEGDDVFICRRGEQEVELIEDRPPVYAPRYPIYVFRPLGF